MSHCQDTIHHLHNIGSITPKIAYHQYGNMRLSSDIHRLRKEGHEITTTIKTDGKSVWASYELKKDIDIPSRLV